MRGLQQLKSHQAAGMEYLPSSSCSISVARATVQDHVVEDQQERSSRHSPTHQMPLVIVTASSAGHAKMPSRPGQGRVQCPEASAACCQALCWCGHAEMRKLCRRCAWWGKPGSPAWWCERCGAFQRLRAHHCAVCERCVDTHDHHCMWLGTCIGARNQAMGARLPESSAGPHDSAVGCISEPM